MSKDRIEELAIKINQARKDYYNGISKISDAIYDAWIDELAILDPKNPAVIGIGSEPVSKWDKYTHLTPMGSLNKVQTEQEYKAWHEKYVSKDDNVLLTLKEDGLSVALVYENGLLKLAATRGSGDVGELITSNVMKMIGVPLKLSQKINITVRGEILLSKENHEKYFAEYSNPRNAASGISRRYDGVGSEHLDVVVYDLTSDLDIKTREEQFQLLKSLGFNVPDYYVVSSIQEVNDIRSKYTQSLRDQYQFCIDGLVIHLNDLAKQEQFGILHGRPYATIAYKFDSIAREATISDIVVQVGNSGRLTPVAIFNPKVNIMGADIERASLHNFSNIEELGIDIGAKVLLCRSNDVIPYIEEVIEGTGTIFEAPLLCPECGEKVIHTGEYVQCINYNCKSMTVGRIKNWIKELNILEFGDSLIERLVESGKVSTVADLYKLTIDDLASIDRMGKKSAKKCYDNLWAYSTIPLEVFLGALSISGIGKSTIKLIMENGADTLEKIGKLKAEHFEMVSGIGPVKAKSLEDGLKNNQQLILSILNNGVKIKDKIIGKLSGKSFCITGTLSMKRADVEKMIIDNGGEMKSSVGKGLSYLVIADPMSNSSKAVNAKKLGTKLLGEQDLLDLLS